MNSIANPFLSRKFILALLTIASATGLVLFHHISDGVYSAVVIATIGAYFTANVTQKVKTTPES